LTLWGATWYNKSPLECNNSDTIVHEEENMGRPIFDKLQYLEAWNLYKKGMGPAGIQRWLEDRHPENPASLRTVKNWLKKFTEVDLDDPRLEEELEWHKIDEHGLPWESSRYLLSMGRFHLRWAGNEPTFRHAIWWWRVHQAIPSEGDYDIWGIADHFVVRELANTVMGARLGFDDLEAWLAYQPWKDAAHLKTYCEDVDNGIIPPLLGPERVFGVREEVSGKAKGYAAIAHIYAVDPRWPNRLPSDSAGSAAERRANWTQEEIWEHLQKEARKLEELALEDELRQCQIKAEDAKQKKPKKGAK
jgi:hypothetical protein